MKLGRITLKIERIIDLDDFYQIDAASALIEDDALSTDSDGYQLSEDSSLTLSDISEDVIADAKRLKDLDNDFDDTHLSIEKDPKMPSKGWAPTATGPKNGWSKMP